MNYLKKYFFICQTVEENLKNHGQLKLIVFVLAFFYTCFSVKSCFDLLKCQAFKAACPLELLAAERLSGRLIAVCNSSEQLLSKEQLVIKIYSFVRW